MKFITLSVLFVSAYASSASTVSVGFFSSVETYSYQTGAASSEVKSYDGFDDVDGPMNGQPDAFNGEWTPGGESEYYGVKINGGAVDEIPYSNQYEKYKRAHKYDTEAEMLAARPVDATYTHVLHVKDEDNGAPNFVDIEVDITAPNVAFNSAQPTTPMFSINGVDGVWTTGHDGIGVFTFDPNSVSEFTVTMSLYNVAHQGTDYVYAATVGNIDGEYQQVGHESSGIQSGVEGDPMAEINQITLTFTKGLSDNAGDSDESTYGFGDGSAFELEGEFVNAWIEQDAIAAASLGVDEVTKGFVYQSVSAFQLRAEATAVPEPSAVSLLGLGSLCLAMRRKR